ncbi:DUF1269 domain-containing protein [Curtobacterium sp. 18060]|uniref:DUF1269 domain-containing protein n=1 Tax=Curtobacterium sp. 18060 TaxID=2681408 RepID=UPI00135935DC|nr:DUF1269 domain-containing protein [Curtobacterium sp. 18060]
MSDRATELVVIAYDDDDGARAAHDAALRLDRRAEIALDGIAVVHVDEHGRTHVDSTGRDSQRGARAASSAVFGTVLGFLFLMPFAGLVVGGAVGALFASLDRAGVDADFRERLAVELARGGAAVIVSVASVDGDRLVGAMTDLGGTVLRTTLSDEDLRAIAHDLGGHP